MASMAIQPPAVHQILGPVLTSIPAAAFSTQPAAGVLPLLSPILRQRVQLFSSSSHEPWLRLLCYDAEKSPKLSEIARSGSLEPHPVSGEVEVDWDLDVETRYRRLDKETLQALVALQTLDLVFQLVYCVGDHGGDGWRIGEVSTADKPSPFTSWGSSRSISEAETEFKNKEEEEKKKKVASTTNGLTANNWHSTSAPGEDDDDDDDDDYWARYDATPARTPAMKQSPVPASMKQSTHLSGPRSSNSAEDAYYAQYNTVQPAMDNYDPDEAAAAEQHGVTQAVPTAVPPPLGLAKVLSASSSDEPRSADAEETSKVWTMVEKETHGSISSNEDRIVDLVHPRPASSASSNGSQMVAKLEESAGKQEQSEFGVKQHVSRSIRSLFMLSQASGIDREEFERLVKTELDLLGMAEDEI